MCKTDKNVESFLESEMMAKKPTIENSTVAHVLKEFPITNLDDLRTIERKLKKDETFHSSVVRYLIFFSNSTVTHARAHTHAHAVILYNL